ncbi:hypothetical protein RN001_006816 [Aquatica leii]|uniref:DOC domain-containing protein n=1 Tax=Aquatica leii TaxID=1421715 RepID=A0AAN7PE05_9COLE|nr:hypothetical protein RN001_006816 [Aquatica leii]
MGILKNYLLNCSIPALPYVANARYHWSERLYWIICITLSWALAIYIMIGSYDQFKNNPVSFTVDTSYLHWKTKFPAIIICEKGNSKYRQYANKFFDPKRNYDLDEVLKDIVFFKGALEGISQKCKKSPPDLGYSECPVATANYTELTKAIRSSCKEMFGYCSWNHKSFNCCKQMVPISTIYGVCYGINSLLAKRPILAIPMQVLSTGKKSVGIFTLELLNPDVKIFALSREEVPSYTESKSLVFDGISLSPHLNEKNIIFLSSEETINEPEIINLKPHIRRCRFPSENYLTTARVYSYPACIMECLQTLHIEACNCTHHLMPGVQEKHVCNIDGLICLTSNFDSLLERSAQCDCTSSCTESEVLEYGTIVYSNYKKFKNNQSTTQISFKFRSPNVRYVRKMVNGYLDLIVYMGGTAGLCIGASLLTIHWVRLDMHSDIVIKSLKMIVDPTDNSYMPSVIVVSGGNTVSSLSEVNVVNVKATDNSVTLLSNLDQHYPLIEVAVIKCRNGGIDCKVHGLSIVGLQKQNQNALKASVSFLANDWDLNYEQSGVPYIAQEQRSPRGIEYSKSSSGCRVFVWGLNDKDQLGRMKGSKVKLPVQSDFLSQLRPIHVAGGLKSLFIVSQEGKLYACGEGTNGRLGLGHNNNVCFSRQIPFLSQYVIKKVAVHSGGKHALALTLDGKVFSWGEGDDGKLGHGNRLNLDKPKMIEALRSKRIRDIACGSSHSAAITSSGELYTWGLGEYGGLGHGDNVTQLKPKQVKGLIGHRVIQVACGSRDAQTLALSDEGLVFS